MLAWMSRESLEVTLRTGEVTYYSRSRRKLWRKGETSGNVQSLRELRVDCDGDALLLLVDQNWPCLPHRAQIMLLHLRLRRARQDLGRPTGRWAETTMGTAAFTTHSPTRRNRSVRSIRRGSRCMCVVRQCTSASISANARPVVVFDLLYRLLRHEYGDGVRYVRNITGHRRQDHRLRREDR